MAAIMNDSKRKPVAAADVSSRAVALQEVLRDKEDRPLTDAERGRLAEWLNQLADHVRPSGGD